MSASLWLTPSVAPEFLETIGQDHLFHTVDEAVRYLKCSVAFLTPSLLV